MNWAWVSIALSAAQIVMVVLLVWACRHARRLCRQARERLVLAEQLLAEIEGHKAAWGAMVFAARTGMVRFAIDIDPDDEDDGKTERGPPLH